MLFVSYKVKGDFPISEKFLPNMISIARNKKVIHHSHVTGKIIGYTHNFCNQRTKENHYTIPVFAHNQFRFDFFLFLKEIRPSVWETSGIEISGRNLLMLTLLSLKARCALLIQLNTFNRV